MVLKVLTGARKVLQDRDPRSLQSGLIADIGLHQYLRRMNGTQREHHFKRCTNSTGLAFKENLNAGRSLSL
jgi:hypothetical protein